MEWRVIPSFPNYEASDSGRVRHARTGRVRTPADVGGALVISLYCRGRMTSRNVGALVLEAFVGPRPGNAECSHLNGDYRDSRLANLRWESQAANLSRKREHGTHGVKLNEEQVSEVRRRLAAGETQRSIARALGINQSNVSRINSGKAWADSEV